ncbi:IclR family transcriptional regulator [Halopenitus persicus]|uniref:Transcriptional regulator, IclR family n=1 Tax=Halopenitus persicus TaxID=1048396 RepID=A0A1H3EIS1_9EURY|nr:IclR family transcriptional regulator [Halopenitus persicus]QHS17582.1 IclR family transcriptional regulator [haloarchaeon 3A1-DGR]SDX78673.1 transcriptional regulator, IclR family [Halopenitus persicus]
MARDAEKRTIQSVDRGCELLESLRRNGPSTISELAADSELSAGSVHTYLSTLRDHGFVDKDGTEYRLGSMFIPFGVRARNRSTLYAASKTIIQELALETGGCVHLMAEYDGRLLILEEVYGEDAIGKDFHIEKRGRLQRHVHCTAGGKAILAHLPESRVHEILDDHGLPSRTSRTITDRERLLEELETVRDRGYARNDQEHMPGIRAVGAPILHDEDGTVLGTVSVSGSAASWTGDRFERTIPAAVTEAANDIEIRIHSQERGV